MSMSLTKTDRQIMEKSGFKVHKYSDGYVEIEKKNRIYAYDSLEQNSIEGLSDYKDDPFIGRLLEKLKSHRKC